MTNLAVVLFGATILYISITSRLGAFVKILALQGVLLFATVAFDSSNFDHGTLIFLTVETLGFKACIIPWFLMKTIKRNAIYREIEPYIPHFYSLLITTCIFAFGFAAAHWAASHLPNAKPLHLGIALSTMMTGLFVIMTRKKILTHVLGYMTLQNGIFMLTLSTLSEMPLIVNLGLLLDLFTCIFLLGIFFDRISLIMGEAHISGLADLKD